MTMNLNCTSEEKAWVDSGLKVSQGTGAHSADAIVSLSSGEILVTLVGVSASTIGATDFVQTA
ncbi:MAG: hypothetical protein NTX56_12185 [Proteobacteria bacterium]|nr:hypothetical protein [Pseudomonadota bacterium]